MIAFLYIEVGDAAKGGCAQIDVGLGLDLAGAADDGGQLLARDFGGQGLGVAGLLAIDEQRHNRDDHHDGENNQKNFLHECACSVSLQFQFTQLEWKEFPKSSLSTLGFSVLCMIFWIFA